MKTILLSTDFSPTALNAAKYVAHLSSALQSQRIIIYHSYYGANTELMEITDIVIAFPGEDSAIKKEALAKLVQLKTELSSLIDTDAQIELVTDDRQLLEGIQEIVKKEKVDLVAGGMCGAGDEGKNSVGKHTAKLIKNRSFPILVIPASAGYQQINTAVLACDLRETSKSLPAEQIKSIVKQLKAKLLVVNIDHKETLGAAGFFEEETALHQMLDDVNPEFYYIDHKDPVEAIRNFTIEHNANLLLAVPKPHGFLEKLFHRSATEKLAVNTVLPLLLLYKN